LKSLKPFKPFKEKTNGEEGNWILDPGYWMPKEWERRRRPQLNRFHIQRGKQKADDRMKADTGYSVLDSGYLRPVRPRKDHMTAGGAKVYLPTASQKATRGDQGYAGRDGGQEAMEDREGKGLGVLRPLDRLRTGKQDLQGWWSSHLIGFSNRFEFPHILSRELLSDLFKMGHGLRSVQTLSTMQAHFGFHLQDGSIRAAFKDLFDLFLHKFPAADGTFFK